MSGDVRMKSKNAFKGKAKSRNERKKDKIKNSQVKIHTIKKKTIAIQP